MACSISSWSEAGQVWHPYFLHRAGRGPTGQEGLECPVKCYENLHTP